MQILVDSSVWIDHIRKPDAMLESLLDDEKICTHPFVIGELALGSIASRANVLASIKNLSQLMRAEDFEVLDLIERHSLFSKGLGLVDAHLLASCLLSSAALWTRDKALHKAAENLGIAAKIQYA